MIAPSFEREILDQLSQLGDTELRQVLEYARGLTRDGSRGEMGSHLVKQAGCIPSDALVEMERAIKDGCEAVDPNGW
jgi:hypothetical protein